MEELMMQKSDPRLEAQVAFENAKAAARHGKLRDAERWSKTAERLVAAAEKFAALPQPEEEDEDALREEIMGRIKRLCEGQEDLRAWQQEDAIYQALKAQAEAHNLPLPPPIRPCPGGDDYLMKIAGGVL